jgi:hypothetical protein
LEREDSGWDLDGEEEGRGKAEIWRRRRGRFVSWGRGLRERETISDVPESKGRDRG